MNDDASLLSQYAKERSEAAFSELVRRKVGLVYSAALRRTGGNPHHAEDVAQQVFAKLAREAGKVSRHPALSAWLYTATRNTAINLMRSEQRRVRREHEAQAMRDLTADSRTEASWDRLRPVLDAAVDQLNEADRTAVILRFFENRPFAEIGTALHLTENSARMRTDRALDKLRSALARRGLASSSAALVAALGAQAATAAPAGFAHSLTSAALATGEAGAGSGWLRLFLAMNKIKAGIAGGLVIAGLATALVELHANRTLGAQIASLQAVNHEMAIASRASPGKNPEANELIALRNRIAQLKARPAGVVDAAMKPRAEWRNVGRATPAAALETVLWSLYVRDLDTIATSLDAAGERRILDTWFATLSETVRVKYGSPERILAPLAATTLSPDPNDPAVAYQVIDQQPDHGPDVVKLTCWERLASGREVQVKIGLADTPGNAEGWRLARTGPGMKESDWQALVFSQINPTTGEVIPRPKP